VSDYLDPSVAKLSPALYAGAIAANLNTNQASQVNQIAGTVNLNKKLMSMNTNDAKNEWKQLDPHVQEQLKSMYGEASYVPQTQDNIFVKAGKGIVSAALSPFRLAVNAAGVYNRFINEPYLVMRQVTQGANPFSWNVWKGAWDGKSIYDNGSLQALHGEYGNTDTFVAMKTLEGLKPGEIIDAYGTVNSEIIGSITKMINDPDNFKLMLNKFKGAQVSVGRDFARVLFNAQPNDNKLYSSSGWNKTSGFLDALTQIIIDPLTWATGGTSKAITRADRLAESLAKGEKSVSEVFARQDIRNTWDKVAGPLIKDLADARTLGGAEGKAKAVAARDKIRRVMPDLNNDDMLKLLTHNEIFDASKAEEFFSKSEPMLELLSGKVDGTTFFRTGIPIAKRTRNRTSGINKLIGDYFNGSIEAAQLEKTGDAFMEDVRKIGVAADPMYVGQTPMLEKLTGELASTKRKLGRYAARFPGSGEIGILDKNVDASLPTVRGLARTIYPKAHAEYFAEAFRASDPADRAILLRGLYTQILHGMGLPGKEGGQQLIEKILQDKFGDSTSFLSQAKIDLPPQFNEVLRSKGVVEAQPETNVGGLLQTTASGPVHFFNSKPTIGNLPWSGKEGELSLADFAFNFNKGAQKHSVINAAGGFTRNQYVRKLTNSWSVLTLFPRLGIRSAMDEAFFYSMMAPGEDIIRLGAGRKFHKAITAFTGDESSIPPIKRMILNKMGKNPAKFLTEEGRFTSTTVNGEERFRLETTENIAANAVKILEHSMFRKAKPQHMEHMYQAMVHHPEVANAIVNSSIGKSAIGAGIDGGDLASMLVSNSHLTNMFKELGMLPSGSYKEEFISELEKINPALVTAAHYQNWFLRFTKNARNLGKTFETYINPGETFIRNNGLRTPKDVKTAVNETLSKVGINPQDMTVTDQKLLNSYLELSQQTVRDTQKGLSGVDIAVKRIEHMYADMYTTFHGNAVAFNDRLYNYIRETATAIQDESRVEGVPTMAYGKAVRQSLDSVDYAAFENLTKGFAPVGTINTDLNFAKDLTNEGFMQKLQAWAENSGNSAMEWMDAQNNHLFRQPALWATYVKFREKYARLEAQYAKELTEKHSHMSQEFARELAEKKFTEVAMNHAGNYVLKAVDNPQIRSNLAWTLRTSGRFYRATEDFYRRVFRLKDVTPQVLYRMRLAHLGLQSNGFIHPDQNGDPYLVMPADNIIFHAINGSMSVFGANVQQPLYNDFAVKLALGNPSFQQDAGQPTLSGPFAAVPILALQKMLSGWGGDVGKKIALDLDNAVLGNVNQNLNWTKAIIPSSVQRIWSMLPKGEQDQQETSAAMQAVAYNAANGLFLSPDKLKAMPVEEQAAAINDYLKGIKITAHNVIFMRAFLGLLSPIAPAMQESKDIPDYLKNAGVNGLRPEFSDILQAVMRNSRGRIQDPYEAALMAFTGKHPGKLVYTVARDEKQTKVLINKTKSMQNWMLSNSGNISKYGEASLIFGPHVGEYDSNVYLWMQGAGLLTQRKLSDYYDEVSIAQDRQKYYDIRSQAESMLQDPTLNIEQRQRVVDAVKILQDKVKAENPRLKIALESKAFGIGKQEDMLIKLKSIVADPKFEMTDAVRKKMNVAITIADNALTAIQDDGLAGDFGNGPALKQEVKQRALAAIRELGGSNAKNAPQDPIIAEATRAVFLPLLDFYARNTMKAIG